MSTHPPLFRALASRFGPQHPVSVLARRIAVQEDANGEVLKQIDRLLVRGSAFARVPAYHPPDWHDPNEREN